MAFETLNEFEEKWFKKTKQIRSEKIKRKKAKKLKQNFNAELIAFVYKNDLKKEKNLYSRLIKVTTNLNESLILATNNYEKEHPILKIFLGGLKLPKINILSQINEF